MRSLPQFAMPSRAEQRVRCREALGAVPHRTETAATPGHDSLSVFAEGPCCNASAKTYLGLLTFKALKLTTFLREYDKLVRQCAAEGLDYIRFLLSAWPN
jgi:hypothetical protein